MSRRSRLALVALLSSTCASVSAWAQSGMTVLAPPQQQYRIGGFDYRPPAGDGWRETGKADNEVRLVFAEQLPETTSLNMRAEFIAHAFAIEDPLLVPNAQELAVKSLAQQSARRRGSLVALTQVEQLAEAEGVYAFTLVSRGSGQDYFERFYVALAPDRSEYVSAKLTTKDTDLDKTPYLKPLQESLASLTHDSAKSGEQDGGQPGDKDEESAEDAGGLPAP